MLIYQSFGQENGMTTYRAHLERLIRDHAFQKDEWTLQSMPAARIEGKGFASAQALETPTLLRTIGLGLDKGARGVAIGNGFDPGLWEARELFDVPILGWLETLLSYSLRVGWRVGIICSGNSGPSRISELIRKYGFHDRTANPIALSISVPEIMLAFDSKTIRDQIIDRAKREIEPLQSSQVDVLIVASGALDVLFESAEIRELAGLPFIPGLPVLVRELESAVALADYGVPFISRTGRFKSPPENVRAAVRFKDE